MTVAAKQALKCLAVLFVSMGVLPFAAMTSAAAGQSPVLRVNPRVNLNDGQTVIVRGYGYPGSINVLIVECTKGASGPIDCDTRSEGDESVTSGGYMFPQNFTVLTKKSGGPSECSSHASSCELVAESTTGGTVYATQSIYFKK